LSDKLQFVGSWIIASDADKLKLIEQSVIEKRSPGGSPALKAALAGNKNLNAWG